MEEMLQQTSQDYSKFLVVDTNEEQQTIEKTIEGILARLEEFQTMMCFHKQERVSSVDLLESINCCTNDLNNFFDKIDSVARIVEHLKTNLKLLETEMDKAETQIGVKENAVTNIFTPLFKKKADSHSQTQQMEAFKVDDYFL